MRVECRCLPGGDGSVFQHCRTVAGLRRVMNYPGEIPFRAAIEQSFQYEMVQALASRSSNRIFYCQASELVSERNRFPLAAQHPGAHTLFDAGVLGAYCAIKQPHLSSCRHDRHEFQHCTTSRREPHRARQHSIAHRNRHARFLACQRLRYEERVAASHRMKIFNTSARIRCQPFNCRFGKRWKTKAHHRAMR